jgi:hypothetical protein
MSSDTLRGGAPEARCGGEKPPGKHEHESLGDSSGTAGTPAKQGMFLSSKRTLVLVLITLAVIGVSNWWAWQALRPPAAPAASAGSLAWEDFAGISGKPGSWIFPARLTAAQEHGVTMVGVLVPHAGMRTADGNKMLGCYLAPPAKIACCGLSCDVRPQFTVLVEFATPQPDPGHQVMARLRGTLRLDATMTGWAATTLGDAVLEETR